MKDYGFYCIPRVFHKREVAQLLIKGHVHEPNPIGFGARQMTVSRNDLKNVKLSQVAVGNEVGVMPLLIADEAGNQMGGTCMIVKEAQEGRTIDVDIVRIDDLVPDRREVTHHPK